MGQGENFVSSEVPGATPESPSSEAKEAYWANAFGTTVWKEQNWVLRFIICTRYRRHAINSELIEYTK